MFPGFVCLVVGFFLRSRAILRRWARDNGYEIVRVHRGAALRSPFPKLSPGRQWQTIYHITVRDRTGKKRSCWLRCGSAILGILIYKTEVIWD
jgi:hypothetical protein